MMQAQVRCVRQVSHLYSKVQHFQKVRSTVEGACAIKKQRPCHRKLDMLMPHFL
uniref:Uncharacterized protein n=1 Tax=Anguilla anguilla TaxID=7936 RepID=A0A0E9XNF2_ANGAN